MYINSVKNLNKNKIINSLFNFSFPSVVKKIKESIDGHYLIAYGEYPPQIRCFDLYNLSLKFQRTINCEIKDFQIISTNWEKMIFLRSDNFLEFHSKSGYYYQIKLPDVSNSLFFDHLSRILYIFSINNQIFRFNIEEGKFISSIISTLNYYNTSSAKSFLSTFLALGNSKGIIELWDFRVNKKPINRIDGLLYLKKKKNEVSFLSFCEKFNYKLYSGFSSGDIILYDLRNSSPIISKKIGNDNPIKVIKNNQINNLILSADKDIIKLWDEKNGKTIVAINTKKNLHDLCQIKNSGFIFISTHDPQIDSKYIPVLGCRPTWCYSLKENKNRNFMKFHNFTKIEKNLHKQLKVYSCLDILKKI